MDYKELGRMGERSLRRILFVWSQRKTEDPKVLTDTAATVLSREIFVAQIKGQAMARAAARNPSSSLVVPSAPSKGRLYKPIPYPTWDNPEGYKGGGSGRFGEDPYERLEQAFTTIYEKNPDDLQRIERLAYDEPIQAAQAGYQHELKEEGVLGYRRQINPDACQVCFWLWKEGYVYPISKPMWRHTGCRCVPIPTTDRIGAHELSEADQERLDDFMEKFQ